MNAIRRTLERLETEGNMRVIPSGAPCRVDFSENDYLGIADLNLITFIFDVNPIT